MSTNYRSSARGKVPAYRPRLMSVWALGGFIVLVLVPLLIAFHRQDVLRQAEQAALGDSLAISYLSAFLQKDPGNLSLRMLLAEHKLYLGELGDIPGLIEPALKSRDTEWQMKGALAEYKYLTAQYAQTPIGSRPQTELMRRRHAVFMRVARYPWPIETVAYLAGQARSLHERDIGIDLYRKITESSKSYSAAWCADTAEHVLGEGNYEIAAELYFIARNKETSVEGQRKWLIAGIRALMSDSLFAQAMQAADKHLGNLQDDPETLDFLIRAARAADDQQRAARYARQMLHLSWLERTYLWLRHLDFDLITSASAAPLRQVKAADGMGSFDDKKFALAYDVFLENRNLEDAYRVAQDGVRQRPADALWHKRLAQVAEWVNQPQIALREWRWLLRHNGGETALLAVLRLAPAMDDYDAALEAWRYKAARGALNAEQWNALADLFEKTQRQRDGIQFFEQRYSTDHNPQMLEIAARLSQRSGDEGHAITLYSRLLDGHPFNSDWALQSANLYLQKGQIQRAYDLLRRYRGNVDKQDAAYWKLMADLSWQLQCDGDAVKNYRRLADSGSLAGEDFSRLRDLLGKAKSEEVAALAEAAYRRSGNPEMLFGALDIYASKQDLVAQKRVFDSIRPDQLASLAGNWHFLLLRATYLHESRAFQPARAQFHRAVALLPDDPVAVNQAMWALAGAQQQDALRDVVVQVVARGDQQNPAYWGALAAAYQVLQQPARAVAYYSRQMSQSGQDFLWLVNYADALDENRQPGMALRVRQYAWQQLRSRLRNKRLKLPFTPDMLAAARLAALNQPDDPALRLVRSVLRQDRLVKQDAVNDAQTSELVLGWAMSGEQLFNAKAWLWQRYGRTLATPVWSDTMIALAEEDTGRLDRLVADRSDGMLVRVRHDAAETLGLEHYAQSVAFNGLTADPASEDAQERLTQDAIAAASFVNFGARRQDLGPLRQTVLSTQVETPVGRYVRVSAEFSHTRQSDPTPQDFRAVPSTERLAGLGMKVHSTLGDTEIAARRRNEFANTTEVSVSHETSFRPRMQLHVGLHVHAEAPESNDLLVFGMRNQLEARLHYAFTKREYLNLEPAYARYYTQTGTPLGQGSHVSWEVGHLISTASPGLRLAAIGIHERFRQDAGAAFPLAPNQNLYGVCLGDVEDDKHVYTPVWRGYFDACGTNNDLSGRGYLAKLGLAGPVAGHDSLSLTLSQGHGGVKVAKNGLEREVKLNYRHFFD